MRGEGMGTEVGVEVNGEVGDYEGRGILYTPYRKIKLQTPGVVGVVAPL
jgi:hypothetical protein